MADPLWRDLLKYSNEGKYGEFAKRFAKSLALAMNQVAVNHQFANSELARNLSEDADYLGIIRRGEHVTVLYRQRSTRSRANGSAGSSSATKMARSGFLQHPSSEQQARIRHE